MYINCRAYGGFTIVPDLGGEKDLIFPKSFDTRLDNVVKYSFICAYHSHNYIYISKILL